MSIIIPEWLQQSLDQISDKSIIIPTDFIYPGDTTMGRITDLYSKKLYTILNKLGSSLRIKTTHKSLFSSGKAKIEEERTSLTEQKETVQQIFLDHLKSMFSTLKDLSPDTLRSSLRIKTEWTIVLVGNDDLSNIC